MVASSFIGKIKKWRGSATNSYCICRKFEFVFCFRRRENFFTVDTTKLVLGNKL